MVRTWQEVLESLKREYPDLHAEVLASAVECLGAEARMRAFQNQADGTFVPTFSEG